MKRLIPTLFVVFLGFLNIISCTKDDPVSKGFITPGTSQSISLEAGAVSSEFVFSTNSNWTARASESWLSVSTSSGDAGENIKLKVSAGENTQYETRSATVTISAGEATLTLTVQQASKKGFEISQASFSIGKDGGNVNIPVKANASYTCTVSESAKSWLSVTQLKSLTDYTIVLSASKNETYDARIGTVTIAYENQTSTITVTQSQNEEIIVTQKEFEINNKGGELRIPVTTNIEYECSVMDGAQEWITISQSQTRGLEEYSIVLQVAENVGYTRRVGQIKVTGVGKESFITIIQGGNIRITDLGDDFYLHSSGRVIATHYKGRNNDDLLRLIYSKFEDEFDFAFYVYEDDSYFIGGGYSTLMNNIKGIGREIEGNSIYNHNLYAEKLFGTILFGGYQEFNPEIIKHELCHTWANYLRSTYQLIGEQEHEIFAHWGFSDVNGMLGGFDKKTFTANIDGNPKWYHAPNINYCETWDAQGATMGIEDKTYAPLELYLMGLISAEEVPDVTFYSGLSNIPDSRFSLADGYFAAEKSETWSIEDIIERFGAREPAYPNTQKEFRILTVILTKEAREIQDTEWELVDNILLKMSYAGKDDDNSSLNFWEATLGKATLKVDELDKILK